MQQHSAAELLRDISAFFFAYFGMFKIHAPKNPGEKYVYYFNYPNTRLSIVVFLPISPDTRNDLQITDQKIAIALKVTKSRDKNFLVEMEDVRLIDGWEDRARERIGALKELVETEVRRCDACQVVMHPKTMKRREPPHTKFVGLVCPICNRHSWTVFGRGLKTRLHTNLKT